MSDKTVVKQVEGIRFTLYKTNRFKNTRISVRLAVPLQQDTASSTALVPALLKHSCAKYPTNALLERKLASLYGATLTAGVEKYGDAQVITLTINSIGDRFALAGEKISEDVAELLCDVLFDPNFENGTFKADVCKREKRLQVEQIEGLFNDKVAYARTRLQETMFAGNPYAISAQGTVEGVQQLTPADITARYYQVLESAKVGITVIGDVDCDSVQATFLDKFRNLGDRCTITCDNTLSAREVQEVTEELPLSQGKLCLGFRIGSTDTYANRVMCDMFGGGVYSKLFRVVREQMSLCYYCSARLVRLKDYLFVQSGIENENRDKALKGIVDQLTALQKGDFTDEDFAASIRGLDDTYAGAKDTAVEIDIWNASQLLDSEVISVDEYKAGIDAVTRERVIEAAKSVSLDTVYTLLGTAKEEN